MPSAFQSWRQWWPATAMMLCSLLSYLDRQALAVLSPTILAATGLDARHYAEAISAFSIAYMLANPVWGALLDRVGLRWGMAAAVAAWSLASGAHAWVAGFAGLVAARIALGFSEAATFPGCLRTASDSLPPAKQARGVGWSYAGGAFGAVLTPLLVTPVAHRYGWHAAFLVTGGMGFIWIALWLSTVRPHLAAAPRTLRLQLPDLRERRFWAIVCSYGVGVLPLGIVLYLAPLYLSRGLGLTQAQLGAVFWIPPLGWAAGGLVWGWLCDRYSLTERHPLATFALISVLGLPLLAITHVHSLALVLALMTVSICTGTGFIVAGLRVAMPTYPREQMAMVGGIGSGSWSALLALVLPPLGRLFDAHRYGDAFAITALLPALATLLWFLVQRGSATSAARQKMVPSVG